MTTATVSSKGQAPIPAHVRQALQVDAGDRVEFVQVEPGRFELIAATQSIQSIKGMFGKPTSGFCGLPHTDDCASRRLQADDDL